MSSGAAFTDERTGMVKSQGRKPVLVFACRRAARCDRIQRCRDQG